MQESEFQIEIEPLESSRQNVCGKSLTSLPSLCRMNQRHTSIWRVWGYSKSECWCARAICKLETRQIARTAIFNNIQVRPGKQNKSAAACKSPNLFCQLIQFTKRENLKRVLHGWRENLKNRVAWGNWPENKNLLRSSILTRHEGESFVTRDWRLRC